MSRRRTVIIKDPESLEASQRLHPIVEEQAQLEDYVSSEDVSDLVNDRAPVEAVKILESFEVSQSLGTVVEEPVYTFDIPERDATHDSLPKPEVPEIADTVEDFDKKIRESIKRRNAPITEILVQKEVKPVEEELSDYRVSVPHSRAPKMPISR